jgi:two-component system, OmpR family, sensor histidine kinase CreC
MSVVVAELWRVFPELRFVADGVLERAIAMSEENAAIVFSHLSDNALRHKAGTLRITVFADSKMVRVEIADDGEGISAKNRDKVFDPFFTTRRESGGTGMGLGIVQAMLHAHGGSIRLVDADQGAAFEIWLRAA